MGLRVAPLNAWPNRWAQAAAVVPISMTELRGQDRQGDLSRLIEAAGRQDRVAFVALFNHFAPRIKAMMLKSGLPDQRAEDVAQDTMLLVWRKAEQFDPAGAGPATWVYTIARNVRTDALRLDQRRQRLETALLLEPELQQDAADALFSTTQLEEQARAGLAQLNEEQKAVVTMSFFEGKAHGDIAQALGIPLGTVKSRLRLAMKRLRSLLEAPQ